MSQTIRPVEYYHANIRDRPGSAYSILTSLAEAGVNLVAFSASPVGATAANMVLFPEDPQALVSFAGRTGLVLSEPARALLVQGNDEVGALAEMHRRLADARISVFASSGVTAGEGRYGYVIHVRADDFDAAARALEA